MPSEAMNGVGRANSNLAAAPREYGEHEYNPFAAMQATNAALPEDAAKLDATPNAPLPRPDRRAARREIKPKPNAPVKNTALVAKFHNPKPERRSGALKNGAYRSNRMRLLDKHFGSAKSSDALHAVLGDDLRKHFSVYDRRNPYSGDISDHDIDTK
ncbi:MAG: hypothetical protein AAGF46_06810, partial [Pseudomonadota bacterium]